jgi:hypothetical protein
MRRPAAVRRALHGRLVASPDEGRSAASVTDRELQGWYRDPFGLHDLRYYHAGRPTRLVRDGAHEFYEEAARQDAPQPWPPGSAPNWGRRSPGAPGYGGGASGAGPEPSANGTEPGGSLEHGHSYRRSHRSGNGGPRRSARKRAVAPAVVAVTVVGAIVAVIALRGNGGNPSITPVAFVSKAATHGVPGGGAFDEHEIVSGGTVYLQLVVEGQNILQAATGSRG